ncbi:MAG: MBL fold metallo-hydrolase [Clostridiaceae bacterium]|nr:MBL fold metallo-hydrolase [Clostridiaceae bacterium]
MKINVLLDNESQVPGIFTEHGLSMLIEDEDQRILFDFGQSEAYYNNAVQMKIDLSSVDLAVISHGHYDHTGGVLRFTAQYPMVPIFVREKALLPRFADRGSNTMEYIGLPEDILASKNLRIIRSDEVFELRDGSILFSTNVADFPEPEGNSKLFEKDVTGQYLRDDFAHEQNLLVNTGEKRVLLCGCAHRGIANIMQWVYNQYGAFPDDVIGGFHLRYQPNVSQSVPQELHNLAIFLKSTGSKLHTMHCTGLPAFRYLKGVLGNQIEYAYAGSTIEI